MRFHNLCEGMVEEQCSKKGLERMVAKISPGAGLIVESKGKLAARSSKM